MLNIDDSGAPFLLKIGSPKLDVQPVCFGDSGLIPVILDKGAGSLLSRGKPKDFERLHLFS